MRHFEAGTGRHAVYQVCKAVLDEGVESAPRGQRTLEIPSPVAITIHNPSDTLPTAINRQKLLPAIGAAEALQNVAGVAQPHLMHRISKFFPKPTSRWDEGIPTYGERLNDHSQLAEVVRKLQADPDSRQAVALIWRPDDMTAGQAHNLCTIGLHFMVRHERLKMVATMRSNDAWYGLCYDLFQFAQVQISIANALGLKAGTYTHVAHSMHLYERHFEVAAELTEPPNRGVYLGQHGIGLRGDSWPQIQLRARTLLNGEVPVMPSLTELWYAQQLEPYSPCGT